MRWLHSGSPCKTNFKQILSERKRRLLLHLPEAPPSSSTQEKTTTLVGIELHHSSWQCKESHRCCCKDLLRRWKWEILKHPPSSPDMSPCYYDLFAKVKEPLQRTRCNTRDELIRAIERLIRNIKKEGRADGVRRLPNVWQKVINKGSAILKVHECCTSVNKATSEIYNCCHYFYPILYECVSFSNANPLLFTCFGLRSISLIAQS